MLVSDRNDMSNIPSNSTQLDTTLPVLKPNFSPPSIEDCKVTWLGHSSVLLQAEGFNILTDPMFSERASPFAWIGPKRYRPCPIEDVQELPTIHAVLISHNHYDHMDAATISNLAKVFPRALWFLPLGNGSYLPKEVDQSKVHELDWWQDAELVRGEKKFTITLVPAQHWTRRWISDTNKALWGGFVVEGTKNGSFWFAGDTGYCPAFKEIGKEFQGFSISAIPVGAYEPNWFMRLQHVNRQEAVEIHRDVKSRHSLGIHWGTFKLTTEFYLEPRNLTPFLTSADTPFVTTDHGSSITNEKLWDIVMKQQELIKKLSSGNVQEIDKVSEIRNEIEKELSISHEIKNEAMKHDISPPLDNTQAAKNSDPEPVKDIPSNSLDQKEHIEKSVDIPVEPQGFLAVDPVKEIQAQREAERSNTPESTLKEPVITTRGESRLLVIRSTVGIQANPVKIHIRKSGSSQYLTFTFLLKLDGQSIGFIEKGRYEFHSLEQAIKQAMPNLIETLGPLPDKHAFSPTANGRQTGSSLQAWLASALQHCTDFPPLLDFLKTNSVAAPAVKESFRKHGNLTKKGNYFGGWKTRHFNLDSSTGTVFYSDAKQSEILGSFSLNYAYVIPLSSQKKDADASDKAGFIVAEYKKAYFSSPINEGRNADGLPQGKVDIRHVFYADSVQERDSWVRCMSGVICRLRPNDTVAQELFEKTGNSSKEKEIYSSLDSVSRSSVPNSNYQTSSQHAAVAKEMEGLQNSGSVQRLKDLSFENLSSSNDRLDQFQNKNTPPREEIISKSNERVADDSGAEKIDREPTRSRARPVGMISPALEKPNSKPAPKFVDDQTRCMEQRLPPTLAEELEMSPSKNAPDKKKGGGKGMFMDWRKKSTPDAAKNVARKQLFGTTIQEAAAAFPIREGIDIPVIVYRCIEYLDAKKAADEEGIYRLSGASSVITALRAKFENDGDVVLLDSEEYYDVHAIAGLLKLFFRELSEPLFTFQLRMQFFQVSEIQDRTERITEATRLVSLLPTANYACLRSLLGHLLRIVQKSDLNKMTVRNISIVFSPTLGLPAGLFTLLLAEFSTIFVWKPMDPKRGTEAMPSPAAPAPVLSTPPETQAINSSPPDNSSVVPSTTNVPDVTQSAFMADDIQGLVPALSFHDHISNIVKASTPPGSSPSLLPKEDPMPVPESETDMMKVLKDQLDDLENS